jgi:hypothetical protein
MLKHLNMSHISLKCKMMNTKVNFELIYIALGK